LEIAFSRSISNDEMVAKSNACARAWIRARIAQLSAEQFSLSEWGSTPKPPLRFEAVDLIENQQPQNTQKFGDAKNVRSEIF